MIAEAIATAERTLRESVLSQVAMRLQSLRQFLRAQKARSRRLGRLYFARVVCCRSLARFGG